MVHINYQGVRRYRQDEEKWQAQRKFKYGDMKRGATFSQLKAQRRSAETHIMTQNESMGLSMDLECLIIYTSNTINIVAHENSWQYILKSSADKCNVTRDKQLNASRT